MKGVIQGSITGCLIFQIFIEILCKELEHQLKGFQIGEDTGEPHHAILSVIRVIYADDCTLTFTTKSELNTALYILSSWEAATGMEVKFKDKKKTVVSILMWTPIGRMFTPQDTIWYYPKAGPRIKVPIINFDEPHKVLGSLHVLSGDHEPHFDALSISLP